MGRVGAAVAVEAAVVGGEAVLCVAVLPSLSPQPAATSEMRAATARNSMASLGVFMWVPRFCVGVGLGGQGKESWGRVLRRQMPNPERSFLGPKAVLTSLSEKPSGVSPVIA